ncbi:MAG: hypothetical protein IBX55_00685 [Methyloprofundus sp.]|nr:hypothetical protein [Methyloprofundus sp.]
MAITQEQIDILKLVLSDTTEGEVLRIHLEEPLKRLRDKIIELESVSNRQNKADNLTPEVIYSANNDRWNMGISICDIAEELLSDGQTGEYTIFKGEISHVLIKDLVHEGLTEDLIDSLHDSLYDEVGEVAEIGLNWIDQDALRKAIVLELERQNGNAKETGFFQVNNVEEVQVNLDDYDSSMKLS